MAGLLDEINESEDTDTSAKDKLITARVRLQKSQPFFSYLAMGLNLIETKRVPTAGVDADGNLYYKVSAEVIGGSLLSITDNNTINHMISFNY
jgi:hypothetical protein